MDPIANTSDYTTTAVPPRKFKIEIDIEENAPLVIRPRGEHYFTVRCASEDFKNQLYLPNSTVEFMGTAGKLFYFRAVSTIELRPVLYEFFGHIHDSRRGGVGLLTGGWGKVVEAMRIEQGDLIHFGIDKADPIIVNISVEKPAVKVRVTVRTAQ